MHHNGTDAYLDYSSSLYIRNGVPGIITTFDPSGNVGIGITNPGYLLDVAGNVRLGTNQNRPVQYDSNGGNFRITPNSGGWATGYLFNGSSGTYRGGFGGYGGADALTYYWIGADYNSATLHITSGSASSGASVGINDTTFASKLTISNDDGGADGNVFQRWKYVPTSNAYYLDLKQTVTSGVVRYNFSMVNASTAYNNVLVLDRGNVGMGFTSPSYKLQVSGSVYSNDSYTVDRNSVTVQTGVASGPIGYIGTFSSHDFSIYTSNNERLRVSGSNGNVIIGGSSSPYKLHVVGAGSLLALGEESFSTGKQLLTGIDGSGNAEIQAVHQGTAYRNISLNPNGGDVGIGTTSPGAKLEVNGAVKTSNPTSGTAQPWKLGSVVATSVVLDENNYVEVDINGTLYRLALVNPA